MLFCPINLEASLHKQTLVHPNSRGINNKREKLKQKPIRQQNESKMFFIYHDFFRLWLKISLLLHLAFIKQTFYQLFQYFYLLQFTLMSYALLAKQQNFLQFQKMPKAENKTSENKEIFPLRQSASMIVFKNPFQPKQMLMFKRKGNMSFANAVVFPGGACDKEDIELISNDSQSLVFEKYGKLTAIRQLYQETGILLLPQKSHNIIKKVQIEILSNKNLTYEFFAQTWKQNLQLIIPLIRLVTVQFVKGKRFDTIFYTHHPQVMRINVGKMVKSLDKSTETLDLSNLDDLTISSEGQNYFWQSACEILNKARKNQIILAPPQIIILSCLEKVKSFNQLENLNRKMCIEPICMQTTNLKLFTFFGDKVYDSDKIIEKQPESVAKKSLVMYFQGKRKDKQSNMEPKVRRMYINLKEKSIVFKSDYVEGSLLAFLQQTTPKL